MKQKFLTFQRTDKSGMNAVLIDACRVESLSVGEKRGDWHDTVITMQSGDTWCVRGSMFVIHDEIMRAINDDTN